MMDNHKANQIKKQTVLGVKVESGRDEQLGRELGCCRERKIVNHSAVQLSSIFSDTQLGFEKETCKESCCNGFPSPPVVKCHGRLRQTGPFRRETKRNRNMVPKKKPAQKKTGIHQVGHFSGRAGGIGDDLELV